MRRLVEQLRDVIESTDQEPRAAVLTEAAGAIRIGATKGLLDFFWHPQAGEVEIGLGGEWWGGKLPAREGETAVYHHRKEKVDPGYQPVKLMWERQGESVRFIIHGGFLSGVAEVVVGVTKAVSEALGEATYYRASKKGADLIWQAMKSLESMHLQVSKGNDLRIDYVDQIIDMLKKVKETAEKHVAEDGDPPKTEAAFDMPKQAQALYLKGWDEHPSPNGKRMAYGRTFKLGSVDVPLRIIQEDDAGKAWRVDRKGYPTWEAMFDGKEFKSAAAAGQAVAAWWKQVTAIFERLTKDGYGAHEAAIKAMDEARKSS